MSFASNGSPNIILKSVWLCIMLSCYSCSALSVTIIIIILSPVVYASGHTGKEKERGHYEQEVFVVLHTHTHVLTLKEEEEAIFLLAHIARYENKTRKILDRMHMLQHLKHLKCGDFFKQIFSLSKKRSKVRLELCSSDDLRRSFLVSRIENSADAFLPLEKTSKWASLLCHTHARTWVWCFH